MIKTCIILLLNITFILADSSNYTITNVTAAFGTILETTQYSAVENALYFQDHVEQVVYRLDIETGNITSRSIGYGPVGIVVPIQDHPKYLLVGVRTSLYIMNWDDFEGDTDLRLFSTVDIGKPDNVIADGKVDSKGRLWFGTMGNLTGKGIEVELGQASLYMVDYLNHKDPETKIKPVDMSAGVTWSRNYTTMFYNDCFTRRIMAYDFDLETGGLSNPRVFFSYQENNITGLVKGMTIDAQDNLVVCTFNTSQVLFISSSGVLLDKIHLPVDQAVSPVWGGENYDTLYVSTARYGVDLSQELSGSILAIKGTGYAGLPQNNFLMPTVETY